MECLDVASAGFSVAAGGTSTGFSPVCTTGYVLTGGGCTGSSFDMRVVSSRTVFGSSNHFCAFRNEGASSATGTVYANCCRIPRGR